jgi:hypothetical protein
MTGRPATILLALMLLALVALTVARAAGAGYWDRLAWCETRGNWGMRGSTYEGGVGFAVTTWRWWASELGLLERYPHAWMAPRVVQVRVAAYGRNRHRGWWGCFSVVGTPPHG